MRTTTRDPHSTRPSRSAAHLRWSGRGGTRLRRLHQTGSTRPGRRPAVRRLAPLTRRGVRPLLRLVASNPSIARSKSEVRPRHLSLVGAVAQPRADAVGEPWMALEPRSHVVGVLGLAAAGLVALATSIGRLLSPSF